MIRYNKTRNEYRFYHPKKGLIKYTDCIFYESIDITKFLYDIKVMDQESEFYWKSQ